ncbi:penicillin acylase family protein [Nocardia sp. NPDC047038]|uniref:penicillin acylase family protein n=1 Tax=Nocardia sp. NPDC047038 TaxID=3154338 RepID=UPI0033ECA1A3
MRRFLWCAGLVLVLLATVSPAPAPVDYRDVAGDGGYRAVIRRTSHGIAHILAFDYGGLGFGQGWAYAEDRSCDLVDQIVKVRAERSRWFGRGGGDGENLTSDAAYRGLDLIGRGLEQLSRLPADARAMVEGYAAGFNSALARHGARGWCAGQEWVGPVTAVEILAYERDLAISASSGMLLRAIAAARPPGDGPSQEQRQSPDTRLDGPAATGNGLGSNGWALGGELTASGRGALIAGPHYPWQGESRFWEAQLTIPGMLNVYGVSLGGMPGIQIGFNDNLAWTHMVAPGYRFALYSVELTPGDPTSYRIGDAVEQMGRKDVVIDVLAADGRLERVTRTLWSTRYGPVLTGGAEIPRLDWTARHAVTLRDANLDNDRLLPFWLALDRARDVAEAERIHLRYGTAWVQTVAADSAGRVWFGNASATPNLGPAAVRAWETDPLRLLDGSDPDNDWRVEDGAPAPGLLPPRGWPRLTDRDVVFNANNSHWVAHPSRRLEGYTPLLGPERTELDPRARLTGSMFTGARLGEVAGADRKIDLSELSAAALSNRSLVSRLLLPVVRAACADTAATTTNLPEGPVDLTKGCAVLSEWDGGFDVDSRGAVLWRETMRGLSKSYPDMFGAGSTVFATGFDPADPLGTPRDPRMDPALARTALAGAVRSMTAAGLPVDVPLGQVQRTRKGDRWFPVPGSVDELGVTDIVRYNPRPGTSREPVLSAGQPLHDSDLTTDGYVVNEGTSFVLAVEFTDRGPRARGLLTFAQSTDPASPYFADQQDLFARNALRECLFTEQEIATDSALRVQAVSGGEPRSQGGTTQ